MHFKLFPQPVYINRRTILKKMIGSGLIVLLGNEESGMNYKDNTYPFRQDSSFLYYFGLDVAGLAAVIDTDSGEEIIFGNELSIDDIIWTGPLPTIKEMAESVGIHNTKPYQLISKFITAAKNAGRKVHFLPPYRPENNIKLAEWLQVQVSELSTISSEELVKAIVAQRSIKEDIELVAIEEAVSISADMHFTAMHQAKIGMKEYELAAKVMDVAYGAGGRLSYPVILTVEGQVLHNHYHGNTMQDGHLLLVDAGAEQSMHYAGDLTRTFPVGRQFSTQQREMYDIVLSALELATSMLKPGALFIDIHAAAAEELLRGLKLVGLVKGDPAEAVRAGAHTMFFQCGLGHMMGLDVHDMEDLGEQYVGYSDELKKRTDFGWKSLRLGKELEPGFVLTVEPGIYIIPELIDRWKAENKLADFINYDALEAYRNFTGIRIENNFHITHTGHRRLGKYLPDSSKEIESIRDQYFS
jgi:Xaa-Pro aminopeptidase